jgi:thiamine biosynthesis lipoprotein
LEWTGLWLGSAASIRICHLDSSFAQRTLRRAVAEAQRLERIFSLYQPDSALNDLNRTAVLVAPPRELVDLLALCDRVHEASGGLFDPTVQPLWTCYHQHYMKGRPNDGCPDQATLQAALSRTGWGRVRFNPDIIALERGMALTLNGVAQGYVTDRVLEILRAAGFENCLVDMGEIRTTGVRSDGRPWQVAVAGRDGNALSLDAAKTENKAVATSSAEGFAFDSDATNNHLFNPVSGRCAMPGRSITVVAPTAAEADAFSTAFALMGDGEIAAVTTLNTNLNVHLATRTTTREFGAASNLNLPAGSELSRS